MKSFLFRAIAVANLLAIIFFISKTDAQTPSVSARVISPTQNYEISLGTSVTPTIMVTNLGPSAVSGMKLYYRIQNVVTGFTTYYDSVTLSNLAAQDSVELSFAPYATNPDSLRQLGTFDACVMAQDTECSLLFGLRRTPIPFIDPSDDYSKTVPGVLTPASIDIPDQTLWTSLGATVVDGEESTWDPPPPRYPNGGVGPDSLVGPVIRFDRLDYNGKYYSGNNVGDTLTSFPINLQGKTRFIVSFDYMRAGRHRYPLGWDADTLFGPENTVLDATGGQVIGAGDSLVLEFLDPSQPATNPSPKGWNEIAAIDGGRDFEFKTLYARGDTNSITISIDGVTKTETGIPDYLTSDFRFRLRLKANNNQPGLDDADPWYIDNPRVMMPIEPSVEMNWVRVVNPYYKIPMSQAVFPVFAHVVTGNIEGYSSVPFTVQIENPAGDMVYSQSIMPTFGTTVDTILQFPDWDATGEPGTDTGAFTAIASISAYWSLPAGFDTTFTKFYLNPGPDDGIQEFALDDGSNEIPSIAGSSSYGIGFNGTSNGSFAMKFQLVRPDTFYGVRAYFGSANTSAEPILISFFSGDASSNIPGGTLSTLDARRGPNFDAFDTYLFQSPMFLTPGTYWVAVSQLSVNNMELGGSISRGGSVFIQSDPMQISPVIRPVYGPSSAGLPWYGTQWGPGPADNNGDVSTAWAIEAGAGSGAWAPVLPAHGWSPEMSQFGSAFSNLLPQLTPSTQLLNNAGIYAPMIRPIIGQRTLSAVVPDPLPRAMALEPNFPNPFVPSASSTSITFTLDAQSPTSLVISNVLGQVVRTLVDANVAAGIHFVSWDGKDASGAIVPAGMYLLTLSSAGARATSTIVVMK